MDHRQKDWPEWLASAEFAVNNKVHTATKSLLFIANYGKELRMRGNIRRKGKVEKTMEFVEKLKRIQEKAVIALKRPQEEMKKYTDRNRKEIEEWKKGDKIMLSTKDLVFKERPVHKLVKRYVEPYKIKEAVSSNAVKCQAWFTLRWKSTEWTWR